MNDELPLIAIERYQTCSNINLMVSVVFAIHHRIWLLLVPVETDVDLQLLQTRCIVIHSQWRSRRVSLVLTLVAVLLT